MKKLDTQSSVLCLFFTCWVTYFTTYLGRLNFTASIAEMLSDNVATKTQLGMVTSCFFVCYGAGQLISGILGDRFNPKMMVFLGLEGSAVLNLCMFFTHSIPLQTVLWGMNGLLQSMAWAPLVKVVSNRLNYRRCVKACVNLATTTPFGTLAAYGLVLLCIRYGGWRQSFLLAFVLLAVVGAGWLFSITALERLAEKDGIAEPEIQQTTPAKAGATQRLPKQVAGMLALIAVAALLHGMLRDGVMTWVPTLLLERFQMPAAFSVAITMLIPLMNLAGVYLANGLHKKYLHSEPATAASFFAATAVTLLLWMVLGQSNFHMTFFSLAIITTAMLGINTMLVSLVPIRFRQFGVVATLTGLMNAITYVGSAGASTAFGWLSETYSWDATVAAWLCIAAAGLVLTLLVTRGWKVFWNKQQQKECDCVAQQRI